MLLPEDMKAEPRRVTVYVDPDLHKALRLKAAETERPYSALVNEASAARSTQRDYASRAAVGRRLASGPF